MFHSTFDVSFSRRCSRGDAQDDGASAGACVRRVREYSRRDFTVRLRTPTPRRIAADTSPYAMMRRFRCRGGVRPVCSQRVPFERCRRGAPFACRRRVALAATAAAMPRRLAEATQRCRRDAFEGTPSCVRAVMRVRGAAVRCVHAERFIVCCAREAESRACHAGKDGHALMRPRPQPPMMPCLQPLRHARYEFARVPCCSSRRHVIRWMPHARQLCARVALFAVLAERIYLRFMFLSYIMRRSPARASTRDAAATALFTRVLDACAYLREREAMPRSRSVRYLMRPV